MAQAHELAEKDYILGMPYKDIAAKHNVSINTVKSWKKRHGWERDKPVKGTKKNAPIAHKNKKGCTPKEKVAEPDPELTEKEQLFCYHYLRTGRNATQAALKAGYTQNKAAAQVQGCKLLHRERVKQELDRLRELFKQDLHLDIQDFLAFCMKIVGADIGDYVAFGQRRQQVIGMYGPIVDKDKKPVMETISYITLGESEQLDTSVIQEVKQGKDGVSIKLADKKWAWDQLIKFFDWLPDKWKREIEKDRLELERKRVSILERKVGEGDEEEDDGGQDFIEALKGKTPEVWGDGS